MKNADTNINNIRIHPFFDQEDPELVRLFKNFVNMVNDYLCFQCEDVCYHPSMTRGKAKHRKITIQDGLWGFSGELIREDQPYTDRAVFTYCNEKIWEMKRRITMTPSDSNSHDNGIANRVQYCALSAAKNYNPDIPWCGPRYFTDDKTGLHYEASYYDHGEEGFTIEESIRDPFGSLLWTAVCEGGYV